VSPELHAQYLWAGGLEIGMVSPELAVAMLNICGQVVWT
jgi:hypothetical protein